MAVKHADQAASEYERQRPAHKMSTARQNGLKDALSALQKGRFSECAD